MPQLDLIIFVYQLQILAVFIMGYFTFFYFFFSSFNKVNKHSLIVTYLVDAIVYVLYTASYGIVHSSASDLELNFFKHQF